MLKTKRGANGEKKRSVRDKLGSLEKGAGEEK